MTLDELKQRATAGELTLIEATEKAVRSTLTMEMKKSMIEFCVKNPPPDRYRGDEEMSGWFHRMGKHINPENP